MINKIRVTTTDKTVAHFLTGSQMHCFLATLSDYAPEVDYHRVSGGPQHWASEFVVTPEVWLDFSEDLAGLERLVDQGEF